MPKSVAPARLWLIPVLVSLVSVVAADAAHAGKRNKEKKQDEASSLKVEATPVKEAAEDVPASGKVVEVLKGDELVLEDGWVVRLLSVDVPTADFGKRDGRFYGKAAIDAVKEQVMGKVVTLGYETQKMDAYDRLLAHVTAPDGTLINRMLVEKGLALAACYAPNIAKCTDFSSAQRDAVQGQQGLWDFNPEDWPKSEGAENVLEDITVRKVIDGDTIQLEDGTIVRYIGIDAPESEAAWKEGNFGHQAYLANKALVEGKQVSLEYDVEYSDPRGRELAYVYLEEKEGKRMVNEVLVSEGVAWVAVFPPNVRHVRALFEAQQQAFAAGKGVWKK